MDKSSKYTTQSYSKQVWAQYTPLSYPISN